MRNLFNLETDVNLTDVENAMMQQGGTMVVNTTRPVNLSEDAILVRLQIKKPKCQAALEKASEEVAAKHQMTSTDRLRSSIRIFTKDALAEINAASGKATGIYYLYTLPWDDKGWRLMPASRYAKVKSEVLQAISEMDDAGVKFVSRLGEFERSFKQEANDLADEVEFPTADDIKCSIELKEMPLANPADIRIRHVSPEVVKAISASAEAQIRSKAQAGMGEAVDKLRDYVNVVIEQCGKEKGKIHDSLIGNLQKQVDAIEAFNFFDDPEVNRLLKRVKDELASIEPDDIRKSQDERKDVAKKASSIFDDLCNFKPVSI